MTGLFWSKRIGLHDLSPFFRRTKAQEAEGSIEADDDDDDETAGEEEISQVDSHGAALSKNPISKSFGSGRKADSPPHDDGQFQILDILAAALRKSLVTCSVDRDDSSSMDISSPTQVRHVSHVTFDRFNGFLGLPDDLEPEFPPKPLSASASVFGVSAQSMQCSHDDKGNCVPTILLRMRRHLYSEGGLKAEGIFRITAENSQEQYAKEQLSKGLMPCGVDVHCLAGLIKAWFRELPTGILDCLAPEQVMHCITEDNCTDLVKLLPKTEAALLDWAINLMADVVQYEKYNKMNAHNIATVFAPNMTKMSDPLTALIHAVQVMKFLKTLILKTLHERELAGKTSILSPGSGSPSDRISLNSLFCNKGEAPGPALDRTRSATFLTSASFSKLAAGPKEQVWSFDGSDHEEDSASISSSSSLNTHETRAVEIKCDSPDWLQLRKGMKKLCRHQMFQFH